MERINVCCMLCCYKKTAPAVRSCLGRIQGPAITTWGTVIGLHRGAEMGSSCSSTLVFIFLLLAHERTGERTGEASKKAVRSAALRGGDLGCVLLQQAATAIQKKRHPHTAIDGASHTSTDIPGLRYQSIQLSFRCDFSKPAADLQLAREIAVILDTAEGSAA